MEKLDVYLSGIESVAISGHVRPDGDCTGSCLAVYNYICRYFPQIEADLFLEPIQNVFRFLANSEKINSDYDRQRKYDLFIALDCGDLKRLGDAAKYFETAKKTLCIDHHISNASFADVNYIEPEASSTSELIYGLMEEKKITKEIAECIYVGLVHDTGVFQYSCTSAKTMRIAGRLMESGIDFSKIVDDTFYSKTFAQNKILGKALLNSELYLNGKVIAGVVTEEEMAEFGVSPKDLDGIVSQLRVTKGIETAVFLYQSSEKEYKVSMRSNGTVEVAAIAVAFGGGGHVRAAGATMEGSREKILERLLEKIKEQSGNV